MNDDLKADEKGAQPEGAQGQTAPHLPSANAIQANPEGKTTQRAQQSRRQKRNPILRLARMVRKHRREGPKWTDIAIVFLTIGIVFLAFMQHKDLVDAGIQTDRIICADERLAKAMEDSVSQAQKSFDAANKQASLTERAWAIARPRLPEPTIVNIGRTPAFEVTALGMLYVSQGPIPDIAKWIESQKDPFGKEKAYIGVLFPGQPMGAHLPGISTGSSPNADPEIRNGRKMVYLILQVDYFTLDVHHISRSCGVWIPDASGFDPGKGCRTWNYVD